MGCEVAGGVALKSGTEERSGAGPLMRDPSLPHQIVLHFTTMNDRSDYIGVSCNCRAKGSGHVPLEARLRWDAEDALAVYRAHLAEVDAA
jgi:hypothetical protein